MTTIAFVGPDGSGKTTVAERAMAVLPDARYLYCGTNPDMGATILPTTRLGARVRGGVSHGQPMGSTPRSPRATAIAWIRMLVWLAEELARGHRSRSLEKRASLVLRDRDFMIDRLALPGASARHERFHRWALARWYPAPDTIIVFDVDAPTAFARKGELDLEELELRRRGYLALGEVLDDLRVVDARRPAEEVADEVVSMIERLLDRDGKS